MAGISNWFSFTSKEEREERSAEYFKRMFPLGAQQKTKEEELLQQLISAKTSDGDKLYQMLIVREALLQKDEKKRLAQLKKWYSARLLSVYSEEDKGLLYFIAEEGSPSPLRQRQQPNTALSLSRPERNSSKKQLCTGVRSKRSLKRKNSCVQRNVHPILVQKE